MQKFLFQVFTDFVKKIIMDGDGKKPLRIIIITDFYKLHENKGKA